MDIKRLHETFAEEQNFRRKFSELVDRFETLRESSSNNQNIDNRELSYGMSLLSGFKFIGDTALRELGIHAPDEEFFMPGQPLLTLSDRYVGPAYTATVILSDNRDAAEVYTGIDGIYLSDDKKRIEPGGNPVCDYYEYLELPESDHIGDLIIAPKGVLVEKRNGYPLHMVHPQHVVHHESLEQAVQSIHGALDIIESTPTGITKL